MSRRRKYKITGIYTISNCHFYLFRVSLFLKDPGWAIKLTKGGRAPQKTICISGLGKGKGLACAGCSWHGHPDPTARRLWHCLCSCWGAQSQTQREALGLFSSEQTDSKRFSTIFFSYSWGFEEKQETERYSGVSALEPHRISESNPTFPVQKPQKNKSKHIAKTKNCTQYWQMTRVQRGEC